MSRDATAFIALSLYNSIVSVMAGLVPAIHVFIFLIAAKPWMPATSAGMTR
jgi:hypothetical protein